MLSNLWKWSEDHQDYYYAKRNPDGTFEYVFSRNRRDSLQPPQPVEQNPRLSGQSTEMRPAELEANQAQPQLRQSNNQVNSQSSYEGYGAMQRQGDSNQNPGQHTTQMTLSGVYPTPSYNAYPSWSGPNPGYTQGHAGASSQGYGHSNNTMPAIPEVPSDWRPYLQQQGLITGTPSTGQEEPLDSSYRMWIGREEREFFVQGRVFAMLWSETASGFATDLESARSTNQRGLGTEKSFMQGRFGQKVYSNIRRFVIMEVKSRQHFVKACPITTYGGRGTTKRGCNPSEHAVVFLRGQQPQLFEGEREAGLTKDPIMIIPDDPNETMDPASRLRFGRTHPIECNVKVKRIGMVAPEYLATLIDYWRQEDRYQSN